MTDKFEDITDDELTDEIINRSLENEFECDCSDKIEEAVEDTIRDVSSDIEDEYISDIRDLYDAYRANDRESLDKLLAEIFYNDLGVIV